MECSIGKRLMNLEGRRIDPETFKSGVGGGIHNLVEVGFKSGFWKRRLLHCGVVVLSSVTCAQRAFLDLACAHSVCSSPWFAGGLVCSWHGAAVCFEVFCDASVHVLLLCASSLPLLSFRYWADDAPQTAQTTANKV